MIFIKKTEESMNNGTKKLLSFLLALALIFASGVIPEVGAGAARAPRFAKKKVSVKVGGKVKLKVKNCRLAKVKFTTSNKKVAIVGKRGVVRGKSAGKAKITGRYRGRRFNCIVTVKGDSGSSSTDKPGTSPTPEPSSNPQKEYVPSSSATPVPAVKNLTYDKKITATFKITKNKKAATESFDSSELGVELLNAKYSELGTTFGCTVDDTITINPSISDANVFIYIISYTNLKTSEADLEAKRSFTKKELDAVPEADSYSKGFAKYSGAFSLPKYEDGCMIFVRIKNTDNSKYGYAAIPNTLAVISAAGSDPGTSATPFPTSPADQGASDKTNPSVAASATLQVGSSKAVTLGDFVDTMKGKLGTPTRIDKAVQGFDIYVYNPGNDYANYRQVYVKDGAVIGFATVNAYFAFDSIAYGGMSKDGLSGLSYNTNARGYKGSLSYGGNNYTVVVYADTIANSSEKGTDTVFGLQVYPSDYSDSVMFKNQSPYTSTCTESGGVYVNYGINMEISELVNAYRVFRGRSPLKIGSTDAYAVGLNDQQINTDFAQARAAEMAKSGVAAADKNMTDRIEKGTEYSLMHCAELFGQKSADAFDQLKSFIYDNTSDVDNTRVILTTTDTCILSGFAYSGDTFMTVDIWS